MFVCFVLEHVSQPLEALAQVRRVLKPGGRLTLIEGDHRSAYFHPWSEEAWRTISCLIEAQARGGGDALIGRRLFPLLRAAGFRDVEGARQRALDVGLIDALAWDAGIVALKRTAEDDGTFNYTFFKGTGVR